MLAILLAWVVLLIDSSCKIRSSVNYTCSTDWSISISFVSDWWTFWCYVLFLSISTFLFSFLFFVTHSVVFEWDWFVWIIVNSFCKNMICCWCNSLSLDRFAETLFTKYVKKESLNELVLSKIRYLVSV